jgi:hypothetical protein
VKWTILVLAFLVMTRLASAEDVVLYCTEKHSVGLHLEGNDWLPNYSDEESGRRYTIRFSEGMTELSGVQGGNTVYRCDRHFPTKAPDVVTCTNPLVKTMVFSFSTKNKRFLFSLVSPGGWLDEALSNEEKELFVDHLIMGQCQAF